MIAVYLARENGSLVFLTLCELTRNAQSNANTCQQRRHPPSGTRGLRPMRKRIIRPPVQVGAKTSELFSSVYVQRSDEEQDISLTCRRPTTSRVRANYAWRFDNMSTRRYHRHCLLDEREPESLQRERLRDGPVPVFCFLLRLAYLYVVRTCFSIRANRMHAVIDKRFSTLSIELNTLKTELEHTNEPGFRRCLLSEICAKLAEMDEMVRLGPSESFPKPGTC